MFSLIITIVSIALVAALALAALYYGGAAFNEGTARAHASRVAAGLQQLMGANELYRAEHGAYVQDINDLVTSNYLKSIPLYADASDLTPLREAVAASGAFKLVAPGINVFAAGPVPLSTCTAINRATFGVVGVLQAMHFTTNVTTQCFGTDLNNLIAVQAKSSADLLAAASSPAANISLGPVSTTSIPPLSDISPDGWLDLLQPQAAAPAQGTVSYGRASLDFPPTATGTSASQVVTVTNTGSGALTFAAPGATVGAPYGLGANTCTGATLPPGSSCSIEVTFTPTAIASFAGAGYALNLQTTSGALAGLPLTGVGITGLVPSDAIKFVDASGNAIDHLNLLFLTNDWTYYWDVSSQPLTPVVPITIKNTSSKVVYPAWTPESISPYGTAPDSCSGPLMPGASCLLKLGRGGDTSLSAGNYTTSIRFVDENQNNAGTPLYLHATLFVGDYFDVYCNDIGYVRTAAERGAWDMGEGGCGTEYGGTPFYLD